jgi:ribosomal protein L32
MKQVTKLVGYLVLIVVLFILLLTSPLLAILLFIIIIAIFLYGRSKNKEIKTDGINTYCKECGAKIEDGNFCQNCGTSTGFETLKKG